MNEENSTEIIKSLREELKASKSEIENFTHYISHDFRAPLRHIMEFIQLLEIELADKLDEKSAKYLEIVSDSSLKLNSYVEALLSYCRSGREILTEISIDLNLLTAGLVEGFKKNVADRKIEWHVREMPIVKSDPTLLKQAFSILLENSIKFTKYKDIASVEIGFIKENQAECVFYVADNGVGFSMSRADRLFNIFQKLHNEKFEGIGMGLAIFRRIIARLGGRVWATGEENNGATFYFTLPLIK